MRCRGAWSIWALLAALSACAGPAELGPPDAPDAALEDASAPRDAGPQQDAGGPDAAPPPDAEAQNLDPVIVELTVTPAQGLAPLTATIAWSASDPDGDPVTCALDADGDGVDDLGPGPCTGAAPWTWPAPGRFTARLSASDARGGAAQAEVVVTAERPFVLPSYLDADFALAGAAVPELDAVAQACRLALTPAEGEELRASLQAALTSAAAQAPPGGHCVVELPAGTFRLAGAVSLPTGVVLRGAGAELTRLQANLPNAAPVFSATGGAPNHVEVGEATRGDKGARRLTVSATTAAAARALLAEGPLYGELSVENDPAKLPPEWAQDYSASAIGQVFRVTGVEDEALVLDRPLNEPYLLRTRRLELRGAARVAARVGLADLAVVREDDHHAATVAFDRTVDAFLLRVWLERTGWAHVTVDRSLACTVRQSYLFDAHDFGDGGRGYGVNLRSHTTGCLIEDNALRRLRHALILQLGSNGNVVAYNAAEDARDNLGWLKADISLHGHYTHMNLIEGNAVEKIHVSDWWGPAPYHTVFNNAVRRGGVTVDDRSEECAVIDNTAQANFPLEEPLRVDRSVGAILCVHNLDPQGHPLGASHRDCDDENDPSQTRERPRPGSFYRPTPLGDPRIGLPAARRMAAGHPVPGRN
jgi:hypothetical protein